ncbi:class I SAM-dependent methyltransferase [Candidatus Woesebacteria bacterium]|jgi:SAM-dependent methyltransferase|nr:class I SAM-dependent methyltransferase [Candidatus Woesebacteria bacterium]
MNINTILSKIDYRLSRFAFSRPQYQVELLVQRIKKIHPKYFNSLVEIGGGYEQRYKRLLSSLTTKYLNLELKKGDGVDVVGSVYKLPFKNNSIEVETLFMVMEHLNEPKDALLECTRVLKKDGYLLITTVQYWHTHNHPSDYLRYTKAGLEYYCKQAGLNIVKIWSMGGPFLVIFHAIELNIPDWLRTPYSIVFYSLANWLDLRVFQHEDKRVYSDSVGWSIIAQKA